MTTAKCPECGREFRSSGGLAGHSAVHAVEERRSRWDRVHAAWSGPSVNQTNRAGPSLRDLAAREGVSRETIRKVLASPRP